MGEAAHVPKDGHLISVDLYSHGYVVAHMVNNRLVYTATYHNRMDALRSADRVADGLREDGGEVYMQVSPKVHFG
jgi:hypothetical protein